MKIYKKRIADQILDSQLNSFGATLIVGPKGCGKTSTAKQKAKSFIEFQDEDKRDGYLATAKTSPSFLLDGETPRLFDEWQDAPSIWGAIRKSIDDRGEKGLYILTGSSSRFIKTPHTGTMRISTMMMYPMSLYESEESNGSVSLSELFNHPENFKGCKSSLSMDELIFAICRGGFPESLFIKEDKNKLAIARHLVTQTCLKDISYIDNVKRNPDIAELILHSYARNICTLASNKTIYQDVISNYQISEKTFNDYIEALKKLYIIDDIKAWCPSIRAKTSIRSSYHFLLSFSFGILKQIFIL